MEVGGHLRKRNKIWHVVLTWQIKDEKGRSKQDSTSFSTKINIKEKEARKRAKEILNKAKATYKPQINKPKKAFVLGKGDSLLYPYLSKAIEKKIARNDFSKLTIQQYSADKKLFFKLVDNIPLSSLTVEFIEEVFIKAYNRNNSSYKTLKKLFNLIFKYGIKEGIFEYNYLTKIENLKKRKNNVTKNIIKKDEELLQFFKIIETDEEFKLYELEFNILISLGLRKGELLGLKFENIDFKNNSIIIAQSLISVKDEETKKTHYEVNSYLKNWKSYRELPLSQKVKKLLQERQERIKENKKALKKAYTQKWKDYICVDFEGKVIRYSKLNEMLNKIKKKYGMKHTSVHMLRHTAATILYLNDVELKDIQHYLGHSTLSTTSEIYTHYDTSRNKNILKVIEKKY
ncbi:MAG: site-specific integrase [Fusobacterium sp.]|nr:site-specific integrase [Fusobacterium sp.]